MNLCIDSGNTAVKAFFVQGNEIRAQYRFSNAEVQQQGLAALLVQAQAPVGQCDACIVASVSQLAESKLTNFNHLFSRLIRLSPDTPLPLINDYESKQSLGYDRIAAAAGAMCLFPGSNLLIIDAGTAITYDFLSDDRHFRGGNISPGINLRLESLHRHTANIPLYTVEEKNMQLNNLIIKPGENTREAVVGGIVRGIVYEMTGYIAHYVAKSNPCKVVVTGGDGLFFARLLKNSIFVHQELMALGLNKILEYNVEKDQTI